MLNKSFHLNYETFKNKVGQDGIGFSPFHLECRITVEGRVICKYCYSILMLRQYIYHFKLNRYSPFQIIKIILFRRRYGDSIILISIFNGLVSLILLWNDF
jgi:hypothetical protein